MPSRRHHADWLQAYLAYTRLSESPDVFHFWSGISTIAGALRGKTWFDMGHFKWTPNFFIVLVAKPGVTSKSTSAGIGQRLLREIADVRFGPNSITPQRLIQVLIESRIDFQMEPGTFMPYSCLTLFASELGTLLDMRDKVMVDMLTDLWDGSLSSNVWSRETNMHGKQTIENPWVNIVACTTPEWIASNIPRQAIGGGFVSRCIFVFGDKKRRLAPYPKQEAEEYGIDLAAERIPLVEDLRQIACLSGEFTLTPDAYDFGVEWYEAHNARNRTATGSEDMSGYLSRKQAHMHKIAMVISAAQSNDLQITKSHLEKSEMILESIEAYMPKVFRDIHASPEMRKADRIVEFLRDEVTGHMCSRNAIYNRFRREMSILEFNAFVDSLRTAGLVEDVTVQQSVMMLKLTAKGLEREEKKEPGNG